MDIEITLEVDEKGTVFINRPHIPYYDDKEDIWRGGIPKNCSVCIVEVKDGVGTVLEIDKIFYDEAE